MSTNLFITEKNTKTNISTYLSIFDKFYYSDALCGAGKTYSSIKKIIELQKDKSRHHIDVIIVPTFILALAQKETLLEQGYNNDNIHFILSKNEHGLEMDMNIATRYNLALEHICETKTNSVIILTQQGFNTINYFHNANNTRLWFDEELDIDNVYNLVLTRNSHLINEYFVVEETEYDYYNLHLNPKLKANKIKSSKYYDMIDNVFRGILKDLTSGYEAIVSKEQWNRLISKREFEKEDNISKAILSPQISKNCLSILTIKTPQSFLKFERTTFLCANFSKMLHYELWGNRYGVIWHIDNEITQSLRYTEHKFNKPITIWYAQEHIVTNNSKNKKIFKEGIVDYNPTRIEHLQDIVLEKFLGWNKKYIFCSNKNDELNDMYSDISIRTPVVTHGLNNYSNISNVGYFVAMNHSPNELHLYSLLENGVKKETLIRTRKLEPSYQYSMRSNLRDIDSKEETNIIVIDRETADFIKLQLGNTDNIQIKFLENSQLNKPKADKELQEEIAREKRRIKQLEKKLESFKGQIFDDELNNDDVVVYSIFDDYKDVIVKDNLDDKGVFSFFSQLKQIQKDNIIENKEDVKCFNLTVYKNESIRREENALATAFLILDIDDKDGKNNIIPKDELKRFCKNNKLSAMFCSTYSNDGIKQGYRAIIPLNRYVNNEEYKMLYRAFCLKLEQETGYITFFNKETDNIKKSGIDISKNNINSIFLLPCKRKGYEQFAYVDFVNLANSRDIKKTKTIKVDKLLEPLKKEEELKIKLELDKLNNKVNGLETNKNLNNTDKGYYRNLAKSKRYYNWSNKKILEYLNTLDFYDINHKELGCIVIAMYNEGFSQSDFLDVVNNLTKFRIKTKTIEEAIKTWNTWIKYSYQVNKGYLINLIKNAI